MQNVVAIKHRNLCSYYWYLFSELQTSRFEYNLSGNSFLEEPVPHTLSLPYFLKPKAQTIPPYIQE